MADLTEYASSMLGDEMFSKTLKSLDSLKVTDPWRVYIISNYIDNSVPKYMYLYTTWNRDHMSILIVTGRRFRYKTNPAKR